VTGAELSCATGGRGKGPKGRYVSREQADRGCAVAIRRGAVCWSYLCEACGHWHLSKRPAPGRRPTALETEVRRAQVGAIISAGG